MNNRYNEFLLSFAPFDKEFSPGNHLCDKFSNCFLFNSQTHNVNDQLYKLDDITIQVLSDPSTCIIISDVSIKNHITTSVSYVYSFNRPVIKTCYHAINVSITEAKLFTIRCGINQVVGIQHIKCIVVITDSLYTAKKIFDLSLYLYQIHSAAISCNLRDFFNKDIDNCIKFWDCPSNKDWLLHSAVNKDSKSFNLSTSFPCKSSWNFSKKYNCNDILSQWKMSFQASDLKGRNFLDLLDDDFNPLELSNIKDSPWLQHFSYSNSLYVRATRAIVNHTSIGEYRLRFFPREDFSCPYRLYSIESQ